MNDSKITAQCYFEQNVFFGQTWNSFFFTSLFKIMKYSLSHSLNPLSLFQEQIKLIMRCTYLTGL